MKTLAECVRIRNSVEASNIALLNAEKKFVSNNTPYNGFVLTNPRFGLTLEELRHDFSSVLSSVPGVAFDISFLPNEEIVLKARPATSSTIISNTSIEAGIKAVKPSLSAITSSRRLANSIQLCALDDFLNLSRRELDASATRDGWSQVAAKGVPPRSAPRQAPVGEKSVYTVLGSRLKDVKKKKETEKARQDETVVEDWEEEVRREEAAKEDAGGSDEPMIRAQEVRNETSTGKETRGE
jgi:transcriptional repressor NF-X1